MHLFTVSLETITTEENGKKHMIEICPFTIMILKMAKLTLSQEIFLETMQLKVSLSLENLAVISLSEKLILEKSQLK